MSQISPEQPFNILLVEDDQNDAILTELALADARLNTRLATVPNGRQALKYLSREDEYDVDSTFWPDVILADLKMPVMDGLQLAGHIRSRPGLNRLPVIILSTSEYPGDVDACYEQGCNAYLVKPHDIRLYSQILGDLVRFWSRVVRSDNYLQGQIRLLGRHDM